MIQTQYYLSNLSSSYNILQDCGNCSRSVNKRCARRHGIIKQDRLLVLAVLISSADD